MGQAGNLSNLPKSRYDISLFNRVTSPRQEPDASGWSALGRITQASFYFISWVSHTNASESWTTGRNDPTTGLILFLCGSVHQAIQKTLKNTIYKFLVEE